LELEYHFPRHSHFLAEDGTFSKLMKIVKVITNFDENITCGGMTIHDMKKDMIGSHMKYLGKHMSRTKFSPLTLSTNMLPLTIYAKHATREDSLKFAEGIMNLSTISITF